MNLKSLFAGAFFALVLFGSPVISRAQDAVKEPVAVVKTDGKPIVITRTYKVGDVMKYKNVIKTQVMGADVTITGGSKITVKEVKADGNITLERIQQESTVEFNGNSMPQPAGKPLSTTVDKYGKLVSYTVSEEAQAVIAPEVQKLLASIGDVITTSKEVKATDSWETELDNPTVKGKTFKLKTTYLGTEKVQDIEYQKFEQSTEVVVDDAGAKMSMKLIAWLNPADGATFKIKATIKGLPTAMFGPLDWDQTLTLAKMDDKKAEAVSAVKSDGKPVSLVVPMKVGDEKRYKSVLKAITGMGDAIIKGTQIVTVKEISKDGNIKVETATENNTMEFGGQPQQDVPAEKPSSSTRDKYGKLVDFTVSESQSQYFAPEAQKLQASLMQVVLTGKEVTAGDSWETELENPMLKDKTFKVKTTYLGTEKVEDVEYWKLEQTAETVIDADGAKMTSKQTVWLNPMDGSLFKKKISMKNFPSTIAGSIEFDITVTAAKKEDKKAETKEKPL